MHKYGVTVYKAPRFLGHILTQPALPTESKTLVSGTLRSAWRMPRAGRMDHQNASLCRGADRENVTSGAERAAVPGLAHILGLGSVRVVIGAMRGTQCARQPQYSNGSRAAAGCAGALLHVAPWFLGGSILILGAECIDWCSRPLSGGLFAHVGRMVDRLVRAAAAAAPISGVLCGSSAGFLAHWSACAMK